MSTKKLQYLCRASTTVSLIVTSTTLNIHGCKMKHVFDNYPARLTYGDIDRRMNILMTLQCLILSFVLYTGMKFRLSDVRL